MLLTMPRVASITLSVTVCTIVHCILLEVILCDHNGTVALYLEQEGHKLIKFAAVGNT